MRDAASFDGEPGELQLGRTLASLLATEHQIGRLDRVVIAIAGESGSGKSVTATGLARALEAGGAPTVVLHQDDYFHRPPRANHEHRILDLGSVGPQEVNLELMRTHIAAFRAGANDVTVPRVDYPGDRFLARQLDFSASRTLIVEGTYVLGLEDSDVRIFLDATSDDTRERRRATESGHRCADHRSGAGDRARADRAAGRARAH